MTGLAHRAVARKVAAAQLPFDILDGHSQTAVEKIFAVATHSFGSSELQAMRIAPLGGSRDDDRVGRESCSLAPGSLQSLRHRAASVADCRRRPRAISR